MCSAFVGHARNAWDPSVSRVLGAPCVASVRGCLWASGCVCISVCMPLHVCIICVIIDGEGECVCVPAPWGTPGSGEDAEPILSEVNRGHLSLLEVPPLHPPLAIQLSLSVVERQPADIKKGQQYYWLLIQLVTVYLGLQLRVSFQRGAWERLRRWTG